MSDLSLRVADRYRHDRLRKAIVVSRWLLAKGRLAPGLKAVLPELQAGEYGPVLKALDTLWMVFEIHESPGEIGTIYSINAEWFYPLGPRLKSRVKDLITRVKDLRRSLTWNKDKGEPPRPNDIEGFEKITQEAAWLEGVIPKTDEGFPHGDFTIIPMKGVSSKDIDACLGALDKAAGFIRLKFPQVLYGKVYLGKAVGGHGTAAQYVSAHDTVSLSTRASATVGDVHALCHELGHRFYHKFWKNKEQRELFWKLSVEPVYETVDFDKPTRAKLADEFISNSEQMRTGGRPPTSALLGDWIDELKRRPEILREVTTLGKKFTWEKDDSVKDKLWVALALPSELTITVRTDKVVREPLSVSSYGKKGGWTENFAEAFAFYVMGKALPAEISAIMDNI
jgi:hypothetical protein